MKGHLAVQETKKGAVLPSNRFLQHTAVRPIADHTAQPELSGTRTESRFGHDFSQVAAHAESDAARSELAPPCPVTPTRCPFGGACHTCPVRVQTKLAMNLPGDDWREQEADRMANQLTRASGGQLQRRTASPASPAGVPPIVHEVLRSPGQPLDAATRAFMEPRFGHDFNQVHMHTDARAAESARVVNALAYTVGRDVVFGAGQYVPGSTAGRRLLAHELTHVVQQGGQPNLQRSTIQVGPPNDVFEHQADEVADSIAHTQQVSPITRLSQPVVQRDLARPPRGVPAPLRQLTPAEIAAAIAFNQDRFRDPYSIRVIRDVLGLEPVPAVVDEEFVHAVVEWQAERRMTQDGMVGHTTTRSIYLELVAEGQLRDAILLLTDSYRLPGDLRLGDVRVGTGLNCCHTATVPAADAVTSGGPHCGGGPITICFCRPRIPRGIADYDHFVRIAGHELIHIPHCAVGPVDPDVREFEAFFWEACTRGRAPQLSAAERVNHARLALTHFARIPAALRTSARITMRNQLNNLVAAGGVGPC